MPITKKIVNPEKELRGKKPYNRGPGGLKKKAYQAKPKKLDDSEVPEGAAALKKKLRDTLRLLSKNPKMPADVRLEHERRIEALNLQIAEKQVDQTEQKMATKYRMLKFFESKKADRKIKVFIRQHPDWESNEDEKNELESLKLDLAYIQHYPKTQKYIALYPNENADDPVVSKAREEIREKIKTGLESGELTQFVKAAREEIKSKIISKDKLSTNDAIKLTTEKINSSKKRVRDEHDPLLARAKATAEREATKPKLETEEEEETFFETVPKTFGAAEAGEAKEPSRKKTAAEKKAEKASAPTSQPKKEQPKKEQAKKEQPKQNKKTQAAGETPTTVIETESAEGEEVKKLGKWARKAMRAQSVVVKERATAAAGTLMAGSDSTPKADDSTKVSADSQATTEDSSAVDATIENKEAAQKKQSAEKKQAAKEEPVKSKIAEEKSEESEPKEEVKLDMPKITTLKIDHSAKDDSDSDGDNNDEPVVPVRKIVKIDESLLKELPEVPKRRGGRNLNKFKK
ncbi:18S rRNA maturation protein [Mortierella sp. AM989]|nr:18S rRNA maturation protein [Mortierella sp. AM989]